MTPRTAKPDDHRLERRQMLKTSLLGGALSGVFWVDAASGPARAEPPPPATAAASAEMTGHDIERIAAVVYGTALSVEEADRIAKVAVGVLANLHYLTLLKSEDVQPAFGYAALVDEASRAGG